ncbi:DUF1302 domain-containing protein [Marinobacter nauticus]|uniref:DUF1302 domain-containing protein n=1 Tax=Marinobacter nauticus TaxID=2743 RepID=UPI001C94EDFC|nr:DUF1302 domain-containing protein [Marinobacter nauticus]MBY6219441.1 DUF1302 domain-containing protein [Marinobacter nauticus]
MTRKTQPWQRWTKLPLAVAIAAGVSGQAHALSWYVGDAEVQFNTTLSAGASWRVEDADKRLLAPHDGRGTASTNNYDDGNRNFDKGDTISKIVKGNSELFVDYTVDSSYLTRVGGLIRGRYWYDFELKDENRRYVELNDEAKANASGGELLDAYVFTDWYLGNIPVSARYGKQVVSWGESTYIQGGINTINPVDVPAFRAPGAQLKDALLPVEMFYISAGVTENITLEAFVQADWEPVRIDDCGTFFSTIDFVADGCGPVYLSGNVSEAVNQASGTTINREGDRRPDAEDQFGVAMRWYVPELNDSELGFYFIQYHSRLPYISGRTNGGEDNPNFPNYFIEYPERIDLYGISINTTTPGGWSLGAEYSYRDKLPIQWNAFELITGGLQSEDYSLLYARDAERLAAQNGGNTDGVAVSAYDEYGVSQAQFTLIKFFDQIMGASRMTLVSEFGATYIHDLPSKSEARYGRSGTFGIGEIPGGLCESGPLANINPDNCTNDGFVTSFSWGYRANLSLEYPNAVAGVNLTPALFWSHDVKGYAPSPGGAFNEGSKSIGLSLTGVYQNKISGNVSYTNYFGGKPYSDVTDRDFVSASVSYSF